ncbi:MAG: DUF2147 domain-containing protein [Steroidobacteraceae bacterium]|nr:DUF2147 domain-containing protein [Deltaproteobacteria bacterium]
MKILTLCASILLSAATVLAAGSGDILGIWKTELDEAQVEVYRCGEKICGKIVRLKNPLYTDSSDGQVGTPIIDRKNPDPALRKRPLIGLQIMHGFSQQGDNLWVNGTCYDPKSGKSYRGKIHLAAPGRLELRGFIGIPLFGRTAVWTR